MESRSRKILMMLNDDNNNENTEEIYEPQIDSILATFVEDQHQAIATSNTNSLMNTSTKTMVKTWIDNNDNDFENKDPNFMESNILEADNSYTMETKTINEPLIGNELQKAMTPSKLTSLMDNVETMTEDKSILEAIPTTNAPSGNTNDVDSSNSGDFSPSEGSEYKLPRHAKHSERLIKPINPTSSSSSSSSSSSDSTSSSSPSGSVNNTAEVEINESNMEPEPTLSLNEDNVEQEPNKRRSRKRAEYVSLIRNAKKRGNHFKVNEMNFDSFFDLKLLAAETNLNLNKNDDGNSIKLTEMKAIKFTKGSEAYKYRNTYKSETWTEAKVRIGRAGNRKQIKDIVLNRLYTEKLQLPNRKKEDIRQLIDSNILPKFYEQYYNTIF